MHPNIQATEGLMLTAALHHLNIWHFFQYFKWWYFSIQRTSQHFKTSTTHILMVIEASNNWNNEPYFWYFSGEFMRQMTNWNLISNAKCRVLEATNRAMLAFGFMLCWAVRNINMRGYAFLNMQVQWADKMYKLLRFLNNINLVKLNLFAWNYGSPRI